MKNILWAALIIVVVAGLVWFGYAKKEKPVENANVPQTDYKNVSYQINNSEIKLVDGYLEVEAAPGSASKIITKYFGNEAVGDLNQDGKADVTFLLTQEGGGSGTFFYVVAALKTDTGYSGTNAILLGDRIAPQTTEIKDGVITVNYAERKLTDPMTAAPSVGVSKSFRVEGGVLAEVK